MFGNLFDFGDVFRSVFLLVMCMDYTKLSAIFEALIVSDVNKSVVRVFMMLINCNYFW